VILGHADADVVQDVQQRAIQVSSLALETRDFVKNAGKGAGASSTTHDSAGVSEQSRALLLNTMLIAPAWTRDQERNADLLGTDLLVRAGYSPQGMVTLLEKQKRFETERAADPQAQTLDQQLSGFGINVGDAATAEATKHVGNDQALGALAGAAIGKALQWGSQKVDEAKRGHPKTDERIADAQAYITRYYADSAGRALQVDSWDDAKDQDATADVLENYISAIQAKGKLSAGDVAGAGKLSKASLSGVTRKHAYPNYMDAAVQLAQGSSSSALTDYETALSGPEPAGAIYSEASALYLQTGKQDKAKQVIEAGYSKLQEPPSLTLPLIRTYRVMGRQADADRVAAQCAIRWPKMQSVCSQEAKGQ
jgi:predicted Zn-dependent protease